MENLNLTTAWDKTFPKSDKVNHRKVTFTNRYGIMLAADLYRPKNATGKLPAIAVCGPFGAVKEQAAGLYAQTMAERGFLTVAFDPSYTGESGGEPRYVVSPDINTEDFSAAVDFLATSDHVDSERIGIIGICGWGGLAINAAAADPRIKATVASTMYDMSRVNANGYFDADDNTEARNALRKALAAQRTEDFDLSKGTNGNAPTVRLSSGYDMPIVGLGTYSLHGDVCINSVKSALASGFRKFDTASIYGNEEEVGQGVRESGVSREEIFVATKLYPNQFANPEAAIEESLRKLDIGYSDLMLLHHPGTDDVKAYQAMEKYVAAGKIRSIGLSNYYIEEMTEFLPKVKIKPVLVQNEIHPYYQEKGIVEFMHKQGIVVEAWYPLGGRGHTAALLGNETISRIAATHGKSSAQVILRWDLQRGVVVIPGSSNPDHIKENISIFDFSLTDDEMAQIAALDRNEKHDWY